MRASRPDERTFMHASVAGKLGFRDESGWPMTDTISSVCGCSTPADSRARAGAEGMKGGEVMARPAWRPIPETR